MRRNVNIHIYNIIYSYITIFLYSVILIFRIDLRNNKTRFIKCKLNSVKSTVAFQSIKLILLDTF